MTLDDLAGDFGLDQTQAAALSRYLDLLLGWRRGNITAVRTRAEAVESLLADSLAVLSVPALDEAGPRWLDLGSGAGIPGIPLAVGRPSVHVTLLESAAKKCAFLEAAVIATGLVERARVVHARSEDYAAPASAGREAFDVVVVRAVGGLAIVVELAAPLLALGGVLLAVKSAQGVAREDGAAQAARERCGLAAAGTTPLSRSPLRDSVCAAFTKTEPTADWLPRRAGLATRRPLAR